MSTPRLLLHPATPVRAPRPVSVRASHIHPAELFTPGEVLPTPAPGGERLARGFVGSPGFMLAKPHGRGAYGSVSYAATLGGRRYLAKQLYTQPSPEQQAASVKVTPFDTALAEWTVAHEVPGALKNEAIITSSETTVQIMELMDGDWSHVRTHQLTPSDQVTLKLEAFAQASDHLTRFHRAGYVHGDVKVENLLWSQDGSVRWGDYGVARPLDPDKGTIEGRRGTPFAMAPEILYGFPYDERADAWSLGVTLGEMFVGHDESPFRYIEDKARTLETLPQPDVGHFRKQVIKPDDGRLDSAKLSAGHSGMHRFFQRWHRMHPATCRLALEQLLATHPWQRASVDQASAAARRMIAQRPGHTDRAADLLGKLPPADPYRAGTFAALGLAWRAWLGMRSPVQGGAAQAA